jgi:anti-anti-sigma regulatory factor
MRTQTAKRRRNRAARNIATADRPALRVLLRVDETDAVALKRRLEAAVDEGRHLAIDAGAVTALTTAGAQVLLAAAVSAEVRHLQFRLAASGSLIIEVFGELGLAERIASWLDPAGNGSTGRMAEA